MSSMKDLLLIVLLHCLTSGRGIESNPIDRYGLDGESFHLDVEEHNNLTFKRFVWRMNSNIIMEYNLKTQDVDYYKNEEKLEFDKKTFSLLIKNLANTDSGLYKAETVNDDGVVIHVVTYKLRVQAPVSKPVITNTSDSEGECNSTLKCTVENGTEHSIAWLGNGINNTITHRRSSELCLDNITCKNWPLTCYAENKVSNSSETVEALQCERPSNSALQSNLWLILSVGIIGIITPIIIIIRIFWIKHRNKKKEEYLVKTTDASVGETNQSITTEYDVVRPERMNRPTDLPPEITTIYATVRKTSDKNIC
ncbi:SLAM family member 9-like [Acipenser oxyrinchus oxyrinchus]|uniref:SLAM family member 9-like n=1 Tax=Acipenser oxyrinchus oxyrinchus TaxID=40147 RepID=A0AAD8FNI5_ACIOX|nr:SLAM family member 9-like [Acipenser oxyrinchus oxyrinchus]